MPPPVWNPDWTPDNGQPKWISYADLGPRGAPPGQHNSRRPARDAEPRTISATDMPPMADPMPTSSFNRSTIDVPIHVPADILPNPGDPSDSGGPYSPGTPTNTGILPNIATSDGTISDPDLPGIEARTDVRTSIPASGPGTEDQSWEGTLLQTRKLLRLRSKRYGGYVKSFEDHERFQKARKHLLRKNTVDRSGDMPQDPAGQQELVARLVNAMSNLDGIETRQTRKHPTRHNETRLIDSIGVKCVKDMGAFEMEMLAWDFMVSLSTTNYSFLVHD